MIMWKNKIETYNTASYEKWAKSQNFQKGWKQIGAYNVDIDRDPDEKRIHGRVSECIRKFDRIGQEEYDMFIMLTGKSRRKEEREILQFNYPKIKVREERREGGSSPLNSVLGSARV
jgi:hypothetical protein